MIPPKSNRKAMIRYRKRLYRKCNGIERVIGLFKINRAIATHSTCYWIITNRTSPVATTRSPCEVP